MNSRLGPRLILIINNVRPYLLEDVAQICEEAKVNLIYLLPYLLNLSLIEKSFNRLK
jgi:hypothetical protein